MISLLLHGLVEFKLSIPAVPATLAVVLGMRSGALPQLGGLVGAAVGVFAALKLIPIVIPYLDDTEARASRIDELIAAVHADPPVGESTDPAREVRPAEPDGAPPAAAIPDSKPRA